MRVSEICTADVVCCGPRTTALEAARLMRQKHVGDVVVVSDPDRERVPLGVVTDRDLTTEVLGNGRDAALMPLSGLARTPVVIAAEYEDVHEVLERMRVHGVRRIPVVDGRGALVGIVTLDDLLGALLEDVQTLLATTRRAQRREQSLRR
ncbi:MAG TPA: CBS domain-containing protein [Steroidobacteraceae bacterium]|nr:CBS domain-containing protein [Gammaproteobacteria bacterium]HEV2285580.1 CBS domain-containing protein [Steroidobacteraceae bacterium]